MFVNRELFAACEHGNLERAREIVQAPDFRTKDLGDGLIAATTRQSAPHGYPELVRFLLDEGADATKLGGSAVGCKSLPVLQLLVERGWDVNGGNEYSNAAL